MGKSVFMHFGGGMQGEVSPIVVPDGMVMWMSGAILDSGVPRAMKAPKLDATITTDTLGNTLANAVQIVSWRGKWFFSTSLREYANNRIGNVDRVVWTLASGGGAKMAVSTNGNSFTVVDLGTPAPRGKLVIESNTQPVPLGFSVVPHSPAGAWASATTYVVDDYVTDNDRVYVSLQNANTNHRPTVGGDSWWTDLGVPGSGKLIPNTRISYAIAFMSKGVSGPQTEEGWATCPSGTQAMRLSWSAPTTTKGADAIAIYGRTSGYMSLLATVPLNTTTWIDWGTITPSGQREDVITKTINTLDGTTIRNTQGFNSSWGKSGTLTGLLGLDPTVSSASYQYVFTVTRNANGEVDESGPSPVSDPAPAYMPRNIRRPNSAVGVLRSAGTFTASTTPAPGVLAVTTPTVMDRNVTGVYSPPGENFSFITLDSGATDITNNAITLSSGSSITTFENQPSYTGPDGTVSNRTIIKSKTTVTAVSGASYVMGTVVAQMGNSAKNDGKRRYVANTYKYAVAPIIGAFDGFGAFTTNRPAEGAAVVASFDISGSFNGYYLPTISWAAVPGASGYAIYFYDPNGTKWGLLARVSGTTTSWQDGGSLDRVKVTPNLAIKPYGGTVGGDATRTTEKITGYVYKVPLGQAPTRYGAAWANLPDGFNDGIPAPLIVGAVTNLPNYLGAIVANPVTTVKIASHGLTITNVLSFDSSLVPDGESIIPQGEYSVLSVVDSNTITTDAPFPMAIDPAAYPTLKMLYGVYDTTGLTNWNIYRTGAGYGGFQKIATIPIATQTFTDNLPMDYVGEAAQSFYKDPNLGVWVIDAPPPPDLRCPIVHNGMYVGISGNFIRWTNPNKPNGWPEIYSLHIPAKPVAIKSYAGSIFIFCLDKIRRLELNDPTQPILQDTLDEDGCYAPFTIQETSHGLVFLATTGLRIFRGNSAKSEPITARRLHARFFQAPSNPTYAYSHWWTPSQSTGPYAFVTRRFNDTGMTRAGVEAQLDNLTTFTDMTTDIRSFMWDGRYHLYWAPQSASYSMGGIFQVDFDKGMPIFSWHPIRPMWVHQDEYERPWMLMPTAPSTLAAAQALEHTDPSQTNSDTGITGPLSFTAPTVYEWGRWDGPAGCIFIRTGPLYFGAPHARKTFNKVEVHGDGQFYVHALVEKKRVLSAGTWVTTTTTEAPNKPREFRFPNGTKGYAIDLLIASDPTVNSGGELTVLEFDIEGMPSES